MASAGTDRTDQEQQRSEFHHREAADPVGDAAGSHGTERRTQQSRGNGEAQGSVVDVEMLLDRLHGAVDDGAVVAEQQPAEGGYRCDPDSAAT